MSSKSYPQGENSKIKMQNAKLQLEIEKNINGKGKICVLPNEYLDPSEYIQDLIDQLKSDIFPLFKNKGFAPFTIARNIFCFIDHISALRYGIKKKKGEQTKRIRKLISEFAKFDSYTNSKYKRYADYIVQIYRHDLVHNVRPLPHEIQIIEKNGRKSSGICWFFISSELKHNAPKNFDRLAEYFTKVSNRKNLCHLRYIGNQIVINNYCLFFDLINFLKVYKDLLKDDEKLQKDFIENYKKIINNHKKIRNFILDKRKDKECKVL